MNRYRMLSRPIVLGVCLLGGVSCQQSLPPGGSVGVRNYNDAVVHIGQVDPAYRAYFREQNAANYSLSDQRKAYFAAAQTARTPVREADYRPSVARHRSSVRGKKGVVTSRGGKGRARVVRKVPSGKVKRVAARRRKVSGKR